MSVVRIASVGWQHPDWDVSYYPADIPADWKLAFYANDFRAVVMPRRDWYALEQADVAVLVDEVDEDFRFYLAIETEQLAADMLTAAVNGFAARLGGFLLHTPLSSACAAAVAGARLIDCCASQPPARSSADCWLDIQSDEPRQHTAVIIRERLALRRLRDAFSRLQPFIDASADLLVVVDLQQPDTLYMQEIRTLLELMGIA